MGGGGDARRLLPPGDNRGELAGAGRSGFGASAVGGPRPDSRGRDGGLRCANCGVEISRPLVLEDGNGYCCGGCALGGPCYCSYDAAEAEQQERRVE